jgi:hypothetical protein
VRTGQIPTRHPEGLAIMELFILVIFVLLAVASALGLTADSRDGADWAPSADGRRVARWH